MQPTLLENTVLRRVCLPEASKDAWLREALALQFPDTRDLSAWRAFVDSSVAIANRYLPTESAAAIARFFTDEGPDALLVENLPVDPHLPPPPSDGKRPASKTAVSESVIAGLIEGHASIVSYLNEKSGAPIHEITPVAGSEHTVASTGRVPFACHTDAAFLAPRFCPRGLLLFGLLNQPGAHTAVMPLDRILEAAGPSLTQSLEKPIFRHPSPSSFEGAAAVVGPIVWRDARGVARIAVQTHAVQPVNAEARDAIAQLRALLGRVETERVVLVSGDALLFKNDRVLHGRDAFVGERWLQRAYFTDSLAPFRERVVAKGNAAESNTFVFDAGELL
jgi:L-asparagine oxygenase